MSISPFDVPQVFSDTVNTGIYVLEPKVLNYCPTSQSFDFSQDLFPIMMRNGDPIFGHIAEGYWCDIGNLEEYARATRDILEGNVQRAVRRAGTWATASGWASGWTLPPMPG